jgi:hypothetical protein
VLPLTSYEYTCYGEHITKIKTEKLPSVILNTIIKLNVGALQPATIISVVLIIVTLDFCVFFEYHDSSLSLFMVATLTYKMPRDLGAAMNVFNLS